MRKKINVKNPKWCHYKRLCPAMIKSKTMCKGCPENKGAKK